MNNAVGFIVGALAVKRLTRLIVEDKITEDIREAWFKRFPPETTKLGYLITCTKCTSIWSALTVTALQGASAHRLTETLAMSEAAILLYDAMDRVTNGPAGFTNDDTLFN